METVEALGRTIALVPNMVDQLSPMNRARYRDWIDRLANGVIGNHEGAIRLFCLFTTTLEPQKWLTFEQLERVGTKAEIDAAETAGLQILLHIFGGGDEGKASGPASSGSSDDGGS
jgi:hypothetical protein